MAGLFRDFTRITLPLAGMHLLTQASRAIMAVVGPVLAMEFAFSAGDLGLLSAALFVSYAIVQLPLGLALDLYGPRRVQTVLALVAALGFALFAAASGLVGFAAARLVCGIGVSGGLMAMLKANSQWFARERIAAMTGLGVLFGGLGSLLATWPAHAALTTIGWRGVFLALAAIALGVAAWVWRSVPERPSAATRRRSFSEEIRTIGAIFADRGFLRVMPFVAMLSMLNFTWQGLWAGPWLRDVAGMAGGIRAETLFAYALGNMAGNGAMGHAATWLQQHGRHPLLVPWLCGAGVVCVQVALLLEPTSRVAVTVLWVLFGVFVAGGPAGYAGIAQRFPVEQTGRVSTAVNLVNLVGAFVLQAAIGGILDLWPRTAQGGWNAAGYAWAVGLTATLTAASLVWALAGRKR